jgi:serpin B
MVIVVPDQGNFQQLESSLRAELVAEIIAELWSTNVALTIPKFSFEAELDLKDTLAAMGMVDAFDPGVADFSGIDGTRQLFITDVFHKAFVDVDEAGTEAAAATAVIVSLTSMPEDPAEVTLDRPFIFLVRDIETGTILFIGRVLNPLES